MPWRASSVMEEKARFVVDYERDEQTMTGSAGGSSRSRPITTPTRPRIATGGQRPATP